MGYSTSLTRASGKSESLRTTVPISIVRQFGLSEGDELDWTLKAENNNITIMVEPKKKGIE
ncbi:MAG TPA: AbrB/MazE/SpoVT family DNA-binding domain-containing protein [Thermoplasmatales archaeon]|nr:AbrB/MazE/SpoVT family DNA-binding domain-containing protein [Candidatus Thermoplasmatota archaeon]MDD5779033.1 AbrB/MazE/SpoVT family DNA-binding domain-containing protein [Candidatus Thermoplasmatota archaeon]HDS59027.1 AbrB/MazE/SpoVT family DNA-binding domain-containing protein [Thermoplasmatales archaeon]